LNVARRNTQRINRIIEDVLQLSNRQRVQPSVVSIDEAIQRFANRFGAENPHTNTSLHVSTDACFANIDADHLDQILWNLCTNAALHNADETIAIEILCFSSGQGTTIIDVKDNGKGISDIEIDKLFEPFYSTHHAGTGLGLFIIRELCELNNSSIEYLSSDIGAHFRLTMISAQDMAA
jgi:two-component system sensor histidine kinase PilS (NtrC family)